MRELARGRHYKQTPEWISTAMRSILTNAAQRSGKPSGRPILRPVWGHFPNYLGLGVYGHGVCVCLHSLQNTQTSEPVIANELTNGG